MIHAQPFHDSRASERGGVSILLAFILLTILGVAAFSMSRDSLRDLSMSGSETIGRKSFEGADAGLDWVITWGNPLAISSTTSQKTLQLRMKSILDSIDNPALRSPGPDYPNSGWDSAPNNLSPDGSYRVYMSPTDLSTDLLPQAESLPNINKPSSLTPDFILEVRYLGTIALENTSATNFTKSNRSLWIVRSVGRQSLTGPGITFVSAREAVMDYN